MRRTISTKLRVDVRVFVAQCDGAELPGPDPVLPGGGAVRGLGTLAHPAPPQVLLPPRRQVLPLGPPSMPAQIQVKDTGWGRGAGLSAQIQV